MNAESFLYFAVSWLFKPAHFLALFRASRVSILIIYIAARFLPGIHIIKIECFIFRHLFNNLIKELLRIWILVHSFFPFQTTRHFQNRLTLLTPKSRKCKEFTLASLFFRGHLNEIYTCINFVLGDSTKYYGPGNTTLNAPQTVKKFPRTYENPIKIRERITERDFW